MGKKHHKDKSVARTINVEIAPGNQASMDRYVQWYNHRPERSTPKVKYTDLVNEALDRFLTLAKEKRSPSKRGSAARSTKKNARKK